MGRERPSTPNTNTIRVKTNSISPEQTVSLAPSLSFSRSPSGVLDKKSTFLRKLFSVRILLLGSFVFQVIFMAGITIGTTTYSQKETTTELSQKILDNVVLRVSDQTRAIFDFPWRLANATYYHIAALPEFEYHQMQPELWRQYSSGMDKVIALYIAFEHNAYGYYGDLEMYFNKTQSSDCYLAPILDWNTGYSNLSDANTRGVIPGYEVNATWWPVIKQSNRQIWTDVYFDPLFPSTLFYTALVPVFHPNTGQFVAAIGVDMTSDSLLSFLSTISVSDNAVIWIMGEDGVLLACSNAEERTYSEKLTGLTYAQDSNLDLVRETTKRIMARGDGNQQSSQYRYSLNGKGISSYIYEINDHSLKLFLFVAYPNDDFLGAVTRLQVLILAVSAVAFVISLIVGIWVMCLVTKPLAKLGVQMDEISHGKFDNSGLVRDPSSTKLYEIYSLQLEFQRMATALRSFGRFVPVDIVRHLLKNNTEAVVSVSQKELTVMFSDIKGFTQKVEEMSPQQLSILLSDYLSAMCAIIGENEGTVDKFIGDAIMALWNVPLPVNGHTIKACTTALDSVKCLKKLNPKWKSNGLPEIQCRIGIHTGLALCGNLGSNERLSYTAVGDSVNLASRLEALNKRYDTSILISGEVYEQVKHIFLCRFLDVVVVQGKRHPTHVYELVGEKNKASDRDIEIARIQHEAVVAFFEKRFEESLRHLATLREMLPSDMSVESLSERATAAINNPNSISADWMGYYILTEK